MGLRRATQGRKPIQNEVMKFFNLVRAIGALRTKYRYKSNLARATKFQLVRRLGGKNRKAQNGFEGDHDELPVIHLIEISMITKFHWIGGGVLNLITKAETVNIW
jgi:hypothetical protein